MKSFYKTTVETYRPLWVRTNFSIFDHAWTKIRGNMKYKGFECIKCEMPFKIGDIIGLACFENIGNKVLCENCAKEIS
jgi:hypothetical protein